MARTTSGPVALPTAATSTTLFSLQVYHGGALVLYALRQKVGDAAFQRIERAWVQRYRGRSRRAPTTSSRSPRRSPASDLTRFLRDWLYGDEDAADARPPGLDGQPGREHDHSRPRRPITPSRP